MATAPTLHSRAELQLAPFDPQHAALVAGWAADSQDAFLVAPHTRPPITPERIIEWTTTARYATLLWRDDQPLAYGELNLLNLVSRRWWLGHLLVDPAQRGRGLGRQLVQVLLRKAFRENAARSVTLVVYPQNTRAIRSYQSAGMRLDGYELHDFAPYRMQVQMVRMAIYARQMKPARLTTER